jgi:hypothetical protein
MKTVLAIIVATAALSGCVVTDPYYVQTRPVYVQSAPVYVQPRHVYVVPQVRCGYVQQWNNYYRTYQSIRVCR